MLCAGSGAALIDGAGRTLLMGVAYAELVVVAMLLVVATSMSIPTPGDIPVPLLGLMALAVPVGKLLLAAAPSAQQWVAAGPRTRVRRADPVQAHRLLATVTLGVIGLSLTAVAVLAPVQPGGPNDPPRPSSPSPDRRVDASLTTLGHVSDRHILTAVAWPYANGPRHIGHVSGFGVPSDVFSRFHRMSGDKVLMVSGTDEHGTPITVAADAEGITPREIADRNNRIIVDDLASLGLSYDLFTRTTTENHASISQEIFLGLLKNGYVFPKTTLGAISPSTGRTLPDRYIEGTCPICGYDGARGDQCDNCGNQLDPIDLINPVSKINGETPKFVEEEHYFLDLPAFARALGDWLGTPQELAAQRPATSPSTC